MLIVIICDPVASVKMERRKGPFNEFAIYEIEDGFPVRYVILSEDDMKELAKRMKEVGF